MDLTESSADKLVLPLLNGEDERRAGAAGVGLYRLAARRLRKDKTAMAGGAFFLFVVACCAGRAVVRPVCGAYRAGRQPHHRDDPYR